MLIIIIKIHEIVYVWLTVGVTEQDLDDLPFPAFEWLELFIFIALELSLFNTLFSTSLPAAS